MARPVLEVEPLEHSDTRLRRERVASIQVTETWVDVTDHSKGKYLLVKTLKDGLSTSILLDSEVVTKEVQANPSGFDLITEITTGSLVPTVHSTYRFVPHGSE